MASSGEPHEASSSCESFVELKCVPFSSLIGSGFWHKFSNIVLNKIKLSKERVAVHGYYTRSVAPALFSVEYSSFESSPHYERQTVVTKGTIVNTNTVEEFRDLDKNELMRSEGQGLIDLLSTTEGLDTIAAQPSLLVPFFILTYANLKNYSYKYWFAFPAISSIKISVLSSVQVVPEKLPEFDPTNSEIITSGFFLLSSDDESPRVRPLKSEKTSSDLYGFLDISSVEGHPCWVIRNFVAYVIKRENLRDGDTLKVVGIRTSKTGVEGRIYHLQVKIVEDFLKNPKLVGWERNEKGKLVPQSVDLKSSLDPAALCESSVDFNLKLMKWRLFPTFDLEKLHATKCLLLGSGTLGCNVARCLMAWGVRNITLIDNSTVNYSNPVRQSLFTFQDCVESKPKAEAAAAALKQIYPGVQAKGVRVMVPMPGHPVSPATLDQVTQDYTTLEAFVQDSDVLFLLMDTREARWLPTVMGAAENKIVINAALGFDSYVVMRHGDTENKLGCYFCTDVVAPGNSTKDRTMDQQCTVTRPGVSYIASALAVELLVSLLHKGSESPLGSTPHSIRGFLSSGEYLMPTVGAFDKCTACSPSVVKEYRERKFQFVLDALNDPDYLEKLTGLDKIKDEDLLDGIVELDDDDDIDD